MNLFGNNQVLRLVTSSAANLDIVGAHITGDGVSAGVKASVLMTIGSATTTTIVAAAGTDLERNVYALTIRNRHASLANTITLQVYDGTNAFEVLKLTLAAGEQAIYDGIGNWRYVNAQGLVKTSQSQGSSGAALSSTNMVVLAADVVNNNAVANSIADVTGLSFPVISGETYQFEFFIDYTAQAATTGARFSLNGPSFSRLTLQTAVANTATANVYNNVGGYNLPVGAASSSALTTGNLAYMAGFITPSADGDVIARFASEIANSAITAKAGSLLKWVRTR